MASSVKLSWQKCRQLADTLAQRIGEDCWTDDRRPVRIWGIPRGGGYVAAMLDGHATVLLGPPRDLELVAVERPQEADVAVDDILDTGRTAAEVKEQYGLETYALVDKVREPSRWSRQWIIFPWEGAEGKQDDGLHVVTRMLQLIGEDATRPGLLDTPRRVVDAWAELFEGYSYSRDDLTAMLTRFDGPALPVTVEGISFVSMCEHHLMPYRGIAEIGYTPEGGVIGLSKLPRIVQLLARRLTIQEQLTQDIIDVLRPVVKSACVRIRSTHSCISDRGIKDAGVSATTMASTEDGA